jgi:CheY-like chemotaxis protein
MRKWTNRRCRVLVVNGFDGRQMYASYLEHQGLVVCEATGPRGALRAIRRFHPDVLVTDYVFPDTTIDGPAFIAQVRNGRGLSWCPDTPDRGRAPGARRGRGRLRPEALSASRLARTHRALARDAAMKTHCY